jgi:FdhE protein
VTLDDWLRAHPYLLPLARLRTRIDAAIAAAVPPCPAPPDWDDYREDFHGGAPLLYSSAVTVDVHAAGPAIVFAVSRLAAEPGGPRAPLTEELRSLDAWLRGEDAASRRVVDWLLDPDAWSPPQPGLLRWIGWLTVTASLAPLVAAFSAWRDESRWMRPYCPTCGSLPAMAQLVGVDPGRERFLCCGRCATKWRFGRSLCPFCETESHQRTSAVIEGEHGLRIDYCESCGGYLKTFAGHGGEAIMLADWTSIHLDLAARDRGWRRLALSLYEMDTPTSFSSDSGNTERAPTEKGL